MLISTLGTPGDLPLLRRRVDLPREGREIQMRRRTRVHRRESQDRQLQFHTAGPGIEGQGAERISEAAARRAKVQAAKAQPTSLNCNARRVLSVAARSAPPLSIPQEPWCEQTARMGLSEMRAKSLTARRAA